MWSRSVFRAAQPLKQQTHRYTINRSALGPATNGQTLLIYIGGAAVAATSYYYIFGNPLGPSTSDAATSPTSSTSPILSQSKAFQGGDQGFISLKLETVENVNHNTKKFRFALPNPNDVSGLPITSALVTKYKGPEDAKPTIRPYTPVSAENEKGFLDLLVKKYEGGAMSTHLHDMEPGQRLDMKGPIPKYPWEANKHKSVALISGGTGITPMYQLTRAIFANPEDKTKVTLIFGNLTEEDILLKREFEDLENTYPNRFRAFYLLDKPPQSWAQGSGHITKELLKTVLPFEPKEKLEDGKIFVCGPPGLYKAVSGAKKSPSDQGEIDGYLKELGYSKEQVFKF